MKTLKVAHKYHGFLDNLRSGLFYGVFIDDSGSPGLQTGTLSLHPERKTWVGVVIDPRLMPEVLVQLPQALQGLEELTGATEFHFADVYAGRGAFAEVSFKRRLAIFQFMAYIFDTYRFPIVVQTFDPDTLESIHLRGRFPARIGSFDMTKPNDAALLFLLLRVKWYVENNRTDLELARVFVDEGYKRDGTALAVPQWESVLADGLVCFASSRSILPIQLADFAAFSLNREQLLLHRHKLTMRDVELLGTLEPVAHNYMNIDTPTLALRLVDDGGEWAPTQ